MGLIDGPDAGVRVIVGVHAEAKWIVIPQGSRPPMIGIMTETVHLLGQALLLHASLLVPFTFLFPLAFLLQFATTLSGHLLLADEWLASAGQFKKNILLSHSNQFDWATFIASKGNEIVYYNTRHAMG